ncbi:DUF1659 domain-containing protein [Bacillus sp. B190/17]|uniref:DUF1659 domain-containing protein n=1 Tax=Bacillus lumedeiriae TaxID=3058829 RepID=A0ABW8IC86_9BACI
MAIQQIADGFSMILTVEGIGNDGKPVKKKYTYPDVRESATPENIFNVAVELEKLHKDRVRQLNMVNNYVLINGL